MSVQTQEARIILAIEAIHTTKNMSRRRAAGIYNVPETTLRDRMNGITPKADSYHGRSNLTKIEEEVIVQYVLDRDSRGFSPRIADVRDMANLLLQKRDARHVGKNWTSRFIARRPELKTRFNRVYDYQRGLCEDPAIIEPWFRLVANMRAKYGILDCDFYNFDETGFMMGMIRPGMVVTRSDRVGKPKAIQPGNREWATAICSIAGDGYVVPPFLVVKGRFHLASWYSEHQIPDDWAVATTTNGWTDNKTGFKGSGLIPYDPQAVLSKLDIRLRTPTPPGTPDEPPTPWVFRTPKTTNEALSQSTLIKTRIARHQSSSPTPILAAVDQLSKGMQAVSHRVILLEAEVRTLQEANEALSKRRRAKRTRLQDGGAINGSQARAIMAEKVVVEEEGRVEEENEGSSKRRRTGSRLCGICRKAGHNARTCPEAGKMDSPCDSE